VVEPPTIKILSLRSKQIGKWKGRTQDQINTVLSNALNITGDSIKRIFKATPFKKDLNVTVEVTGGEGPEPLVNVIAKERVGTEAFFNNPGTPVEAVLKDAFEQMLAEEMKRLGLKSGEKMEVTFEVDVKGVVETPKEATPAPATSKDTAVFDTKNYSAEAYSALVGALTTYRESEKDDPKRQQSVSAILSMLKPGDQILKDKFFKSEKEYLAFLEEIPELRKKFVSPNSFVWQDFTQRSKNILASQKYEYKYTPATGKIEITKPRPKVVDKVKNKKAYDAILRQFNKNKASITGGRS
jgi:hypothetical protein